METTYSLPNLDSLSSFASVSGDLAEVASTIKFERECCFQQVNSGYVHRDLFHTQVWLWLRRLKLFASQR